MSAATLTFAVDGNELHDTKLLIPRKRLIDSIRNRIRASSGQYRVHGVYLVPSDKPIYAEGQIIMCLMHLQRWYRWQMAGKTFTLANPIVATYQTDHPSIWYSTNDTGDDWSQWYWHNMLNELRRYTGGGFWQDFDDWIVYLDAPNGVDSEGNHQSTGGASTGFSGVAVLSEYDVSAITGNNPLRGVCGEIGGCGHETGHTFNLHHPAVGPDFNYDIMGAGYLIYPTGNPPGCHLSDVAKATLDLNPFFSIRPPGSWWPTICPFDDGSRRPGPSPRPRPPTPTPRP